MSTTNHNKVNFFIGLVLALLMNVTIAYADWNSGGPYGGYVQCLAIASVDPDVIYAGTESGIFKTADGGAAWTKTGFPENLVRALQIAPDNPNTVWAGTDEGIYKSEDGGNTWTAKGLSGARVNTIAIDPNTPDILYAGAGIPRSTGEIVGVFKSTDGGNNWEEKISAGLDAVMALLIDADDFSYIYAGVSVEGGGPGFYKSSNRGDTWVSRKVGDSWPWDDVVALAMTPAGAASPAIYAVNSSDMDVFKSTDKGDNWTSTNTPFISPASPWAVAVDPNDPDIVYVGTHYYKGRFYKSSNAGSTWSIKTIGLPPSVPSGIVIDPRNSNVYAGLSEGGVCKSTDKAESWQLSSQGMNNTFINDLTTYPNSSEIAYAAIKGEGHHLAKTTDGGTSWDYLTGSSTNRGAVAIDPQTPTTLFTGFGWDLRTNPICYLEKSTDGGHSWTNTGYLFYQIGTVWLGVSDIWVNPGDSNTILVAVAGFGVNGGGVYKSTNGGNTWEKTCSFWAATLAVDPTDPQILYFGSERWGYVFRSTDAGENWTQISPGQEWVWAVHDIEVDLDKEVYAATDEGLMKWAGSDWMKLPGLPTDDITSLAIDRSTTPGTVYVGTGEDGVFVSEDGGNSWAPFNENLENLSITKLAGSFSKPKILYAGTGYGGVSSRSLSSDPLPDIKANGSDGPVTLSPGEALSVTITLDSGYHSGNPADWWVVADTPSDWYHYDVGSDSWMPGFTVTYQGSLFDLSPPFEVLNTSELPIGAYTIYFGVDMDMNGSLDMDQIYYDSVEVTVE